MEFVRETAGKAKNFFTGGNQNNGDPDDGMEVDPPSGRQDHFDSYNHGGHRQGGFSGSGGGYQPHQGNQYPQDRRGTRGQPGPRGGGYSSGYQNQRHQGGYASGHRTGNPAFHEQGGGMFDSHGYNQHQEQLRAMQMREQRHRSLQASKQMVYDVYATTIGMLEEFEDFDDPAGPEGSSEQEERDLAGKSRETAGQGPDMMDQSEGADHGHGRATKGPNGKVSKQEKEQQGKGKKKRDLGRSDVKIPDQSHKTKRDVKAIVEAELVCLQAQLRFCPPEIREQTRQELVDKTLGWVAARKEKGLKKGLADMYASQVVEILLTGETKLHVPTQWEESTGPAGKEAVLGGVRALQVGQHYGAEQDKQFHDDPNKKARCPDIRSGPVPQIHGAQRLVEVNPNLREHLEGSDMR